VCIEGRAALDYPAYRKLVWVSSKRRLLKALAFCILIVVGAFFLLTPAAGGGALGGAGVVLLFFPLSLRRSWRRLAAGGPAVEIGYEVTDEGMSVCLAGVSTLHRWESLRPLRETARYWLFRSLLTRQVIAVPRDAFSADAHAEVNAVFTRLAGSRLGGTGGLTAPKVRG